MQRRVWLKQCAKGGVLASLSGGLQANQTVQNDPLAAFRLAEAQLLDGQSARVDAQVEIHVKPLAPNSAVVPVEIISAHPDTLRLCLLIDNHETALLAQMDTAHALMEPRLSTHMQLLRPSTVTALVETNEGWLKNSQSVLELRSRCEEAS